MIKMIYEVFFFCLLKSVWTWSEREKVVRFNVPSTQMVGHPLCRPPVATAHRSSPWSIPCCTVRMCLSTFGTPSNLDQLTVNNKTNTIFIRKKCPPNKHLHWATFVHTYLIQKIKQLADVIRNGWCVWVSTFQVLFVDFAHTFHAFIHRLVIWNKQMTKQLKQLAIF